jgi:hypothetical protein
LVLPQVFKDTYPNIILLKEQQVSKLEQKHTPSTRNIIRLLQPGDLVLADRGFNIEDDLNFYGAKLAIPAYTREKKQLSLEEVEQSKRLSRVHIHVESVIGLLKQKYSILEDPLPVNRINPMGSMQQSLYMLP